MDSHITYAVHVTHNITTFSLFANNDVNVYILLNAIFSTHAIQLFTFKLPLSFFITFLLTVNIRELKQLHTRTHTSLL